MDNVSQKYFNTKVQIIPKELRCYNTIISINVKLIH